MNSKDELYNFYLSASDDPICPDDDINVNLNPDQIKKTIRDEDVLEEVLCEGLNSITTKRLLINPFLDENLRCNIFERVMSSDQSNDKIAEISMDSFLSNNIQSNYNRIVSRTNSFVDWKDLKKESIKSIYSDFIEKYGIDENEKDSDLLRNKIFNTK